MAQIETWLKTDLKQIVRVQELDGQLFTADNQANLIGVIVTDKGSPVTLTGGVIGYIIRPDGETVIINGSITGGNKAYIVLPASVYVYAGPIHIVIKVGQTTVGACTSYIGQSTTDTIVDPGHVIPSLEELLAQIQNCRQATTNANEAATNANTKAGLADTAATAANTAASNANTKADLANTAATNANSKADLANTAATNANTKATAANNAATAANNAATSATNAATNANTKAGLADTAATAANTAASNANTKAGLADTAATAANTAASNANTKAGLANEAATAANTAASNANTKAGLADTAATNANTKAGLADTAATNANTKAGLANEAAAAANGAAEAATAATSAAESATSAAESATTNANTAATAANNAATKIDNMTVAANGLAPGSSPTVAISEVSGHKHILFGIVKGDSGKDFRIKKTFASIAAMEAYDPTQDPSSSKVTEYDFVMIDTGSVEDPDTGKLYCYEPQELTVWHYIGDLSGKQGIKGETGTGIDHITLNQDYTLTVYYTDQTTYTTPSIRGATGTTPDISIGTVTTLTPNQSAYVELDESSTPEAPVFNFGIPQGETGQVENVFGTTVPMSPQDSTKIATVIGYLLDLGLSVSNGKIYQTYQKEVSE